MTIRRFASKIPLGLLAVLAFLSAGTVVEAATFEFDPSPQTFDTCSATVDVYIDVTGQTATAADIEIFYPNDLVTIADADPGTTGIQVTEGTAFPTYYGNQVDHAEGQILLSAAAISCVPPVTSPSYRLTNQRVKFASITLNYQSNDPGVVELDIHYNGLGNTVDSNIASATGTDLLNNDGLPNGGDGFFTFEPVVNCTDPQDPPGEDTGTTDDGDGDDGDGTGTDQPGTDGGDTGIIPPPTGTDGDIGTPGSDNIFLQSVPLVVLACTTFSGILLLLLAPREIIILVEGAQFAALHAVPELTADILIELPNKEVIEPVDEIDDWFKIKYDGNEGWVYKDNTSKRFKWFHRKDENVDPDDEIVA